MSPNQPTGSGRRAGRGRSVRRLGAMAGLGVLVAASSVGCGASDDVADAPPPSEPTAAAESTVDDGGPATTAEPPTDPSPAVAIATRVVSSPVPIPAPFAGADVGDGEVHTERIVPWQGGFLAIGAVHHPQPLPEELPPDVAALFPQEVVDLFPDGLPPTLDEAMTTLQEAGLYDTVVDIVSANPDAYDSIFSVTPTPATIVFAWSEDGEVWSPIEASVPAGIDQVAFAVAGDRLVAWGTPPTADPADAPTATVVAWTTDLVDWTVDVIGIELPAQPPDAVHPATMAGSLLANESGWTLERGVILEFDPEDLVTPEAAGLPEGETFVVLETLADGVRVLPSGPNVYGDDVTVTWSELGFDDALQPYLESWGWGPPSVTELWASSWDGDPVRADPDVAAEVADTSAWVAVPGVATTDGFLRFGTRTWFSPDGLDWSPVAVDAALDTTPRWFDVAVPVSDGAVAIGHDADRNRFAFRVDATGEDWVPIEVPGLPPDLTSMVWGVGNLPYSPWVLDVGDSWSLDQWLVVTANGVRWVVEDLEDGDDYDPHVAGLSGTTVIVGRDDGDWLRYDLGG